MKLNDAPWVYRQDQEDPPWAVEWRNGVGALIDFSDTGYEFSLKLVARDKATVGLEKIDGIQGLVTLPNVVSTWEPDELMIPPDIYTVYLTATIGGRDRKFRQGNEPYIIIMPAA